MKNWHVIFKSMVGIALSIVLSVSIGDTVHAATSDQVTLSVSKPGAGYITSSNGVNVRSGPSTSSSVVATLAADTKVTIVERGSNGWDFVMYDTNGNYGYVSNSYIREYDLDYYCTVKVSSGTLTLRAGRGTSYQSLASIPNRKSLPVLLQAGTWDYVLYGVVPGYVNTNYITKTHY